MKNTMLLSTAMFLTASANACAGTIYKCRDAAGVTLYQEKACEKEVQAVSSWSSTTAADMDEDSPAVEAKTLVMGQGNGGHYYIDGSVNDSYLNFVIDTGATLVTLPLPMAASAGVKCQGRTSVQTGNGVIQACTATIQKLKFGNFTLHSVQAMVVPNLNQPLLGMNVLKRFRVEQDNGQMRLSRKY